MDSGFPPVAQLVPHSGRALLIDAVLEATPDSIRVAAHIMRTHLYFIAGHGVPSWVGIELMAQAAAAHAGLNARRTRGAPPRGMLLGTRHYRTKAAYFAEGAQLEIFVHREFNGESGVMACACEISCGGNTLAEATLIVMETRTETAT